MRSTANKSTTQRMIPSWQKRSGGRKPMPVLLHPLAEGIEPHWRAGAEQILQTEGRLERRCSGFRRNVSGANQTQYAQLEFVKSVYGERSAYDNERADFYLWLCFMRLRRENSSSSKRDPEKYTGYHCKSFVNNGRYHLTLSNECAILLCVLPQKGGSRS